MQAVARRATKLCLLSDGLPSLGMRYAYDDFGFQRAPYVSECMFEHTCFSLSPAIKGTGHVLKQETGGRLCLRGIFAAVMGRTDFLGRYVVQQLGKMSFQGFASLRGSEDLAIQPKLIGKFGQRRCFASMDKEKANDNHVELNKETISVTFVDKDGEEKTVQVPIGMSMLEAAHHNDIELEGACEGSLACSTCHVIVMDDHYYNKLQEPTDEENDMLDLAFGLTETSRLGCQVIANPELDGMRLALPAATRNFAVDGYVPKPH